MKQNFKVIFLGAAGLAPTLAVLLAFRRREAAAVPQRAAESAAVAVEWTTGGTSTLYPTRVLILAMLSAATDRQESIILYRY